MEETSRVDIRQVRRGTTQPAGRTAAEELEALCWVAGLREPQPAASLDPDRMCDLLLRHGLAGRLLTRVKGGGSPGWCTPAFQQAIRAEQVAARALLEHRRNALRELDAALSPEIHPLTVLPGSEPHALTGSSADPASTEIDVASSDPEGLRPTLEGLGYRVVFDGEWRAERSRFHRDGVTIDLHGAFPVYAYPAGLRELDLAAERHPGIWLQTFPPTRCHTVYWADLAGYLTPSEASELRGIRVLQPELTALVLCARQFHAFIQSPFSLALPVRLAGLARIHEFLNLPDFDEDLFRELTRRWGGEDAVSLAGHLLRQLHGSAPGWLSSLGPNTYTERFPRCVGFYGAWVDLGPAVETLLAPAPVATLERLGMSSIRLEWADGPWSRGPIPPAPGSLERFIVHAGDGDFGLPAICAWRGPEEASFAVRLPRQSRPGTSYRMRLDGESSNECFVLEFDSHREEPVVSGLGRAEVSSDAQGHELCIHLAWPSLSLLLRNGAEARLLLTITRHEPRVLSYYNAEAVIALPLRLSVAR